MSAEVIKLDGAPGVGKSTRLFEYVAQEKASGRALGEIYYLTFARSGREESAVRLAEVFHDEAMDDVKKRAKTFHGAAWVACAVNDVFVEAGQQIIQRGTHDDVYKKFSARHGLSYAEENTNPLKAAQENEDVEGNGNRLFAISDYLTLTRKPNEMHPHAPVSLPLDHGQVVALLEAWEEYKKHSQQLRLFEHGDYVDEAIDAELTPPANVLFIDEFQDLSPQEYLLFKTWRDSGEIDRIYIAGDPNQSIYSFRAGSPFYFEETPVKESETLKESYRCPSEIVSVARGILEECPETDSAGFSAKRRGGVAKFETIPDDVSLARFVKDQVSTHTPQDDGSSVFLLTRANYQANKLSRALREGGIPFEWLGSRRGVWDDPLPDLLRALRTLERGEGGIPVSAVNTLLNHSPNSEERESRLGTRFGDVYKVTDVWNAYPDTDDVVAIARKLKLYDYQRDLLAAAAVSDTDRSPSRVKIGTIHSAKGLEAPCVMLFDAYTPRLEEAYFEGHITAEEHRLYYVGATRPSESLFVIGDYFDGPSCPVFRDGLPMTESQVEA